MATSRHFIRLEEVIESHNSNHKGKAGQAQRITDGRKHTLELLLSQYYNKLQKESEAIRQRPEFFPSLFTNNGHLRRLHRHGKDSNTTIWRHVRALAGVYVPQIGKLFTKVFHGVKCDYEIRMNPYFYTGKVIPNWGMNDTIANQVTSSTSLPVFTLPSNTASQVATSQLQASYKSATIQGKFGLNSLSCDPIEPVNSGNNTDQSFSKNPQNLSNLEVLNASCDNINPTRKNFNTKTTPKSKRHCLPHNQTHVVSGILQESQVSANTLKNQTQPLNEGVLTSKSKWLGAADVQKVDDYSEVDIVKQKVIEFWGYAKACLYTENVYSEVENKRILTVIYQNWFKAEFGRNKSEYFWANHVTNLQMLIDREMKHLAANSWAYRHPDAKKYFDRTFSFGLQRCYVNWLNSQKNYDFSLLRQAKRSLFENKIPRGVKTLTKKSTKGEVIAYWKHRIETKAVMPALVMQMLDAYIHNNPHILN